MNEKHIKHTVKNLIGFANDLAFIDATETEYAQAIQTETKTTLDLNDPKDFELACDFVEKIVDFNTNGEELSLMTSDGYELYAYKSQNIYRNRLFVPIDGTERE